jgi:hypothetical protein
MHHHRGIPAIKSANTTFHYFIAGKFWLVFWGDCVDVISGAKLGNSDVLLLCPAKKGEHQITGTNWSGCCEGGVEGSLPLCRFTWIRIYKLIDYLIWESIEFSHGRILA